MKIIKITLTRSKKLKKQQSFYYFTKYIFFFLSICLLNCGDDQYPNDPPEYIPTYTINIEYDYHEYHDLFNTYFNPTCEQDFINVFNEAAEYEPIKKTSDNLPDPRPGHPQRPELIEYGFGGSVIPLSDYHQDNHQSENGSDPYHLMSIYGCSGNHPEGGGWPENVVLGVSVGYYNNPPDDPWSYTFTMDIQEWALDQVGEDWELDDAFKIALWVTCHELGHSIAGLTHSDVYQYHTNYPDYWCAMLSDPRTNDELWVNPHFCTEDPGDPGHPNCSNFLREVELK